MSEHEHEIEQDEATEAATAEAPQSDDDGDEESEPVEPIDGDDDEPDEGDTSGESAQESQAVRDEKALMKRDQRLDAENARHARRVGEIMEDDAPDLIPCPVCMDGIAGWVYSPDVQQMSEDAILRLRQLIGLSGLEGIMPATFAQRCPDCDGQGEVKTGSRVAGYETATCERCKKTGWIRRGAPSGNGHVEQVSDAIVTGPTVFEAESEDPEIRHLRERGFTVIPPMSVQAG